MRFSLLISLLSEMSSISSLDDDLVIALSRESVASVQVPGTPHTAMTTSRAATAVNIG